MNSFCFSYPRPKFTHYNDISGVNPLDYYLAASEISGSQFSLMCFVGCLSTCVFVKNLADYVLAQRLAKTHLGRFQKFCRF